MLLQLVVKRAIELAERAASSWVLEYTDFLSPPLVADVQANTKKLAEVEVAAWGGFPQAERCRLCIGNTELMASAQSDLDLVSIFSLANLSRKLMIARNNLYLALSSDKAHLVGR